MKWTQPICRKCYQEKEPNREPAKLKNAVTEKCCVCGCNTNEGIYYRVDPRTVKYPTK